MSDLIENKKKTDFVVTQLSSFVGYIMYLLSILHVDDFNWLCISRSGTRLSVEEKEDEQQVRTSFNP